MAIAVCISSGSFLSPPIRRCSPPPAAAPLTIPSSLTLTARSPKWLHPLFLHALASTLSLTLSSSLPAMAAGSPPPPASCQEQLLPMEAPSGPVTNQEIVEEGWQMVEDIFFDARLGHWSPHKWQEMREIVLDRSIITRSKAHDLIRRMLATLDDHYTRFLTPSEFAKMAKYDVTDIGINLMELSSEDGKVKVKVLGIVLDGPAHTAGVRQGDEVLAVMERM